MAQIAIPAPEANRPEHPYMEELLKFLSEEIYIELDSEFYQVGHEDWMRNVNRHFIKYLRETYPEDELIQFSAMKWCRYHQSKLPWRSPLLV
jgi:hypothetical protein